MPSHNKGVLTCRWLEDGAERTRKVREQEIVRVGSSVHTFANETEEDVEFVVFRFVPDGRDKRETIKRTTRWLWTGDREEKNIWLNGLGGCGYGISGRFPVGMQSGADR